MSRSHLPLVWVLYNANVYVRCLCLEGMSMRGREVQDPQELSHEVAVVHGHQLTGHPRGPSAQHKVLAHQLGRRTLTTLPTSPR